MNLIKDNHKYLKEKSFRKEYKNKTKICNLFMTRLYPIIYKDIAGVDLSDISYDLLKYSSMHVKLFIDNDLHPKYKKKSISTRKLVIELLNSEDISNHIMAYEILKSNSK